MCKAILQCIASSASSKCAAKFLTTSRQKRISAHERDNNNKYCELGTLHRIAKLLQEQGRFVFFSILLVVDQDRRDLQSKLELFVVDHKKMHELQWELRRREDEIFQLQRALNEAQMCIFAEREHALKLQKQNDSLKSMFLRHKVLTWVQTSSRIGRSQKNSPLARAY